MIDNPQWLADELTESIESGEIEVITIAALEYDTLQHRANQLSELYSVVHGLMRELARSDIHQTDILCKMCDVDEALRKVSGAQE